MKKSTSLLSVFIILGVIFWSFSDLQPSISEKKQVAKTEFSLDNALYHLKNISQKTHHVGSKEHKNVQQYIVTELEKLGLETEVQIQTAVNRKWFAATTAENIVVTIKGTSNGKSLLLLTHYDSNPHSSLGASDAGAGVVTILEGIRAFLATNKQQKNDIIILISDAEELGLLGAKAFVEEHELAKNIGLILNFEARGSGGPSYMLLETNGKNSKLLSEFMAVKPNFPAASSLMYSVYKMLPNDTDLTVFREEANINGFNFAFIGDHFDYHTAQDSYERLDKESLLHQADYFTTLVPYFANSHIENLNSETGLVYVNFPFIKILSYPFSWILPMIIIAGILFFILIFLGIALNKITIRGLFKGFIPFLVSLILCGGVSYGFWKLLLVIHPAYSDMLHGFTYNGYLYITTVVLLNIWMLFKVYRYFTPEAKTTDLLVAPIFIWLLINVLVYRELQGAAFFILPVFGALLILGVSIFMKIKKSRESILFLLISIPLLYIFSPMVKMFPVGLGLSKLYISGVFLALIFGLMIATFHQKKSTHWLQKLSGFLTIVFFGVATYNSGFSVENKKPNSLVYIQDSDSKTAYFGTYNTVLDTYTKQVFNTNFTEGSIASAETKSKYNTHFTYHKKTGFKAFPMSKITIELDTTIKNKRFLEVVISPQRRLNKLEFRSEGAIRLEQFKVNDVLVNNGKPHKTKGGTFLIYHMGNEDKEITLSFSLKKAEKVAFIMNEISYDLLTNTAFSLTQRTEEMMPMPFVTNDAIIVTKRLQL
jgi:hypothetical protein